MPESPENLLRIEPHGLIVIDKPPGPTSYDCIRFLKRTCDLQRKWKIGHLGTLDPFASGVLVIALGKAVRYAGYALHSTKKYRARLWLGEETDTLDPTGKVIATSPIPEGWGGRLQEVAPGFRGIIEQQPPIYSAKQVDGRRSYKAAREGEKIDLKPIKVEIHSLEFGETGENCVDFVTEVSGGTYIRSLGRDIAKSFGTVGHLVGLERIAVGGFDSDVSIPLNAFEVGGSKVLMHHLRPVDQILEHLVSITIRDGREEKLKHGRIITKEDMTGEFPSVDDDSDTLRIIDSKGRFLSLGRVKGESVIPFKQWV
jgi:tRNA pseudouridine55 synthase